MDAQRKQTEANLSADLVKHLQSQGMTLRQIADAMGLSESSVSRVVNRKRGLTIQNLLRLQDAVGKPLPVLLLECASPDSVPEQLVPLYKTARDVLAGGTGLVMTDAKGKSEREGIEHREGYRRIVEHSIQQIDRVWNYYKHLFAGIALLIAVGITVFTILFAGSIKDMKANLVSEVNTVERQVRARVDEEFRTERIRRLVEDAASEEVREAAIPLIERDMNDLILPEINKAQQMAGAVGSQIAELKASLAEAERKQSEFTAQVAALSLFYRVRQGSRQSFVELSEIAKNGTDEEETLTAALLEEIGVYYEDLAHAVFERKRTVTFRPTGARYRPHAEAIYKGIRSRDFPRTTREALINEIAERGFRYFVEDLMEVVRDDPDLKIAARAAKAISTLAKQSFNCRPPFSDAVDWWNTAGQVSDVYRSPFPELERLGQMLQSDDKELALAGLLNVVEGRSGLADARLLIAKTYLRQNDLDRAIEQLAAIDTECDAHKESLILYAILLTKKGEKTNACDVLEKVKKFTPDSEAFIRAISAVEELRPLSDEERFKKLIAE